MKTRTRTGAAITAALVIITGGCSSPPDTDCGAFAAEVDDWADGQVGLLREAYGVEFGPTAPSAAEEADFIDRVEASRDRFARIVRHHQPPPGLDIDNPHGFTGWDCTGADVDALARSAERMEAEMSRDTP